MSKQNAWIRQSEKTVLTSPILSIVEQKCISSEGGGESTFCVIRSRDWCNIIPVTEDGKVVLIKQFRLGIAAHTLEIPGGVCDVTDAEFEAAALREMEEETGYTALPGARITSLGWTHPNPAILDNRCHLFAVGPVRRAKAQKLDPTEMIEVMEVPLADLPALILDGQITHALMLNAFLFMMLSDPAASALLTRNLEGFARAESTV